MSLESRVRAISMMRRVSEIERLHELYRLRARSAERDRELALSEGHLAAADTKPELLYLSSIQLSLAGIRRNQAVDLAQSVAVLEREIIRIESRIKVLDELSRATKHEIQRADDRARLVEMLDLFVSRRIYDESREVLR